MLASSALVPFLIAFGAVFGAGLVITGVDTVALSALALFGLGVGSGYWLGTR